MKDKQLVRHKPFFINALMNEREQLIVLKSWLDFIRNFDINNKDRVFNLRKNYIIISFILSEIGEQMRSKCNPRGEIMMQIKDMIDECIKIMFRTVKDDRTVELLDVIEEN